MQALRIPSEALASLSAIRDLGPEKLRELLEVLKGQTSLLRTSDLRAIIQKFFESKAEGVTRQLISLYSVKRDNDSSGEEIVRRLTIGLTEYDSDKRWTSEEIAKWGAMEDELVELLSLESVNTVAKALALSFDYANLLSEASIITDIRPIYDDPGDKIIASVISQTLRLHFDNDEGEHSLSIAVDEIDLRRLKDSCDRAIKKAETAKSLMQGMSIQVAITGEQNDND